MKEIPSYIWKEIAAVIPEKCDKEAGIDNIVVYLNNFQELYDNVKREMLMEMSEKFPKKYSWDKITIGEALDNSGKTSERSRHSDLFLGQTHKEFFDAADEAVYEAGINPDDIKEIIDERRTGAIILPTEINRSAEGIFLPVYVVLRGDGYIHKDLTGISYKELTLSR